MADIKRDFLYEFNRGLKESYSSNSAIVSVFEDIDKGNLLLSPIDIPEKDFVEKVGKLVFMVKKIVADPYKVFKGNQEVVPVSKAQNVDQESIKLTLFDTSLWSLNNGKRTAREAYSLVNDYVFTNYENAFVHQLINLVLSRLAEIKSKICATYGISSALTDVSHDESNHEQLAILSTINAHFKSLNRLNKERVFSDNSKRVVDLSEIYLTDMIKSDKRYNFCYRFYCDNFKSKAARGGVAGDFRVLYHNYALVQLMYNLNKLGYKVSDAEYYLSDSGRMFIDSTVFNGDKKITLNRTKNGVDIKSGRKKIHVEFSKSMIKSVNNICTDFDSKAKAFENSGYSNVYVAYLTSDDVNIDGVLEFGYKSVKAAVDRLIKAI